MLVIQGFFENGVFIPNEQVSSFNGRQEAILTIKEYSKEKLEQISRWTEILENISNCNEELIGEPERLSLRIPEKIDAL